MIESIIQVPVTNRMAAPAPAQQQVDSTPKLVTE